MLSAFSYLGRMLDVKLADRKIMSVRICNVLFEKRNRSTVLLMHIQEEENGTRLHSYS